jgi:hypothetical protein
MERQGVAKAQKTSAQGSQVQTHPVRSSSLAHPLLELQRSIGNQAVQRLIGSPYIQTKLQVSTPGDPYEQEADRVADTVMRMPDPRTTRTAEQQTEAEKEETVAPKPLVQRAVPIAVREDDEEEKVAPKFDTRPGPLEEEKSIATKLAKDAPFQRQAREDEEKETLQTAPPIQRQREEEEEEKLQTKSLSSQSSPSLHIHPAGGPTRAAIQRLCTECEEEKQQTEGRSEEMVQRKSAPDQPPDDDDGEDQQLQPKGVDSAAPSLTTSVAANIHALKGGGSPLPETTRAFFEPRFGADFSQVRVHTDSRAEATTKSVNAKAFTIGRNVAFGTGQYSPHSHEGRQLLAHELTHVMQQSGADGIRVSRRDEKDYLAPRSREVTHTARKDAASNRDSRNKAVGDEGQAAASDVGRARPVNLAGAIGGLMRAGLQLQRSPDPKTITVLRGKAAEQKLAELGGVLVTDPDYSGGRKAVAGSHLQFVLWTTPSRTTAVGIYRWTHEGPNGYRMQSLKGVGRPDLMPSAAPGPGGMFVNAHNVAATTIPLTNPGVYKTEAWVRAGVDNNGVFEGYELLVEHSVEVVNLSRATDEASQAIKGADSFQQFHDTMDLQMALLRPGGPAEQNRGHQHQIATSSPNPAPEGRGALFFRAQDARTNRSKPLSYHWYVSPQTKDKPPQQLAGRPIVRVAGRTAYDFGIGPGIFMPAYFSGLWVVWYQAKDDKGTDIGEASYLQTILTESDMKSLEKHDKFMERLDELGGKIEGEKVPVKGVHVSTANANQTQLRLFIGKKKGDPTKFILIDVTPGLDPKANRLEYTSSTGAGVIDEFLSENKYPKGMLKFNATSNNLGIDTRERGKETTGQGFFDRLSTNLSIGGMIALGVGILAAPFTRGQSLQVAMVVSGALTAAGGAVSLYERLQHAEVSGTGVALDVVMIASSIINAGAAMRSLKSGPAVLLTNRTTKFLLWANFTSDLVSALLISVEGAKQIAEIMENPAMSPDQKRSAMIRIVTNLIMSGTMLAVSFGQMREFRTKMESTLGKTLAGKLSDEICMTLSLFDDATLKGLKTASEPDLSKLAGAVRQEPALINVLKNESRLGKILPLMKSNTADDLRFAIVRANAHEGGVSIVNSERLVNLLKASSFDPSMAMTIPKDTLTALSKGKLLDDLEALAKLAQSAKVKNYQSWLGELATGSDVGVAAAAPWAAEAHATANTASVDMKKPWGIDFDAWKSRLQAQGIKGDIDEIIKRAKGGGPDALAARGELRAAERARARGNDVEMLTPPTGPKAQNVKSPEARLVAGGEEKRLEAKTATEPPNRGTWNAHADNANAQIKSSGKPGEISFDWTEVNVRAPSSDFDYAIDIERFLDSKMTKDRLRGVRYFEILWKDAQGVTWITSRTRAADGTLSKTVTRRL